MDVALGSLDTNQVMWGYEQIQEAARFVRSKTRQTPSVALILGSGLGAFADALEEPDVISYGSIPYFPQSTVSGHAGRLVIGRFGETTVVVMQGRFHLYEGYPAEQIVFPVRVLEALGVKRLIVTNAAGAVNADFAPGELMLITDHINLTGRNPLIGANDERLGPRFPDMTEAYSPALRRLFTEAAAEEKITLRQGVYVAITGPAYETPAEIRMYRVLGADACGMSTVPEVLAANHGGMEVCGISCITNMGAGINPGKLDHSEVTHTADLVMDAFLRLLRRTLSRM